MFKIIICVIGLCSAISMAHHGQDRHRSADYADANVSDTPATDSIQYYLSFPIKKNWIQAYEFCNSRVQDLITIDSSEKQAEIEAYLLNSNINFKIKHFWTSGTDEKGHFSWKISGNDFQFTNWKSGEPNMRYNRNCVAVNNKRRQGFKWYDLSCSADLYFICENRNLPTIDIRMDVA